jgi:hypothetical protein
VRVQELDDKSDEELCRLADESFARMEERGTAEAPQHLQTAQFYLSLLNRRHDDRVARRDLRLEIIVIVLIALEIIFGLYEGSQQAAILSDMKTSTAATAKALQDQGSILSKMNDNTLETVKAFGKLQTAQDDSLLAQKQSLATSRDTLKSIGRMNTALDQELNLSFTVAVNVTVDDATKRLIIVNLTRTAIYVWGAKFDDEQPGKFPDERFLPPGGGYFFSIETVFKTAAEQVVAGTQRKVALDLYLLSADGKQYVCHGYILETWEKDQIKLYPTVTTVKQEAWPPQVTLN